METQLAVPDDGQRYLTKKGHSHLAERILRFSIFQCLTTMLLVALVMALFLTHTRSQRKIESLRNTVSDSRKTFQLIEYGYATLQLLELNPTIQDNSECLPFLKHELASSVMSHWQFEHSIDNATEEPNYARDFVARALFYLDCKSAADFAMLTRRELSIYPDDELQQAMWELSDSDRTSFDRFINSAVASALPKGRLPSDEPDRRH